MTATRFGPVITERGVAFRLWAPNTGSVDLIVDRPSSMRKAGDWFCLDVAGAKAGTPTSSGSTMK